MAALLVPLLGAVMVGVAGYCVVRSLTRRPGPDGHRRDLDAWHAAMGGAMALMLLAPLGRGLATAGLVLFGVGLAWSAVRALRQVGLGPSIGLGVGCAAMAAMLVPVATASAATASGTATGADHDMTGMKHMSGMHHDMAGMGSGDPAPPAVAGLPMIVVLVLVLLLAGLVALRLATAVRRDAPARVRLDAGCEVLMGATMAWMLVSLA